MSKKKMKTRLGADGYDYPYTSEGLVFDDKGNSIAQKYATKEDLKSLSIVDELEERVSANEESIAWLMENGGGGGGTISCYISTTDAENFIISTGNDLTLHLDFFSPNVGKGTLKVFINDTESMSATLAQGDTATIISGELFAKGNNIMRVYVIDRTGNLTNELKFNVRYGGTQITSTFDPYISYDYSSIVRYYFTVTALDTSDRLTFYMKIDDELQNPISCTSDVRAYFTFPSTLTVGSHYCEAWAEDSVGKSNVLKFNIVILDEQALVVATDTQTLSIEEGSQFSLDYKVYRKGDTSFITKVYIDNELKETGTCGLDMSFYKNSTLLEGQHTIKLEVYDITQKVSDYVVWTVTITPSTYEMVTATVSGSSAMFTAFNKSNSNEGRDKWIGVNQDGDEIVANLNNFAFNEESGWIDNNLIFNGNSSVEIPITPLANNAKYGFTLDIEFTSKAIGVEDALVLKLWDDEANCGIKITTEHLILRSKAGNECKLYFTDNENTSAIFIIDRDEGFAKIYINGVMCEAFHLSDYMVNGVAYLEDFTVNDTIKLGGSGYCQIKNLRVYEIALATNEILNNFISNEKNKEKQKNLVNFQKGDDLPTLTIYGDFSGLGKDDKKPCSIVYSSPDITKYGESFTLSHKKSSLQYQGTSSMAYPIKNYRINLRDALGNKWKYNPFNGGQPEARFCLKADFITSNHAHNTGMAKFISDKLYNYDTTDESTMNPMKWWSLQNGGKINDTRETINGFPCRLILVNDGESALNEGQAEPTPGNTKDMGIFNFNNDKDNVASFGFDNEVFPNCISYEVTANSDTSAGAFVPYTNYTCDTYYSTAEDIYYTSGINRDFIKGDTVVFSSSSMTFHSYKWYDSSGKSKVIFSNTITIPIDCVKFQVRFRGDISEGFTLNGMNCKVNLIDNNSTNRNPYIDELECLPYLQNSFELRYPDAKEVGGDYGYLGINGDTTKGLKRVIDWVGNCTDEEFVADFEKYFNRHYTFRYFLFVTLIGAVDNLGKNMMLDTWDGQIWYPRFYDIDTILSYDNSGEIKFDVDIEMEQGYWNTSSSRLWTRVRDLFHDELIEVYKDMRGNGVSYEGIMKYMYDEQIAKIPQTYYNKDFDIKYAPYADTYIGKAHGDGYEHMKRWLKNRFIFCDTLFDYAPSYNNDVLTIRANTTDLMSITIETYTPLYQHVSYYNGQMSKEKVVPGQPITFEGYAQTATDQEVLIYGGSNIKKISGISTCNPNSMLIGGATRLTELDISNCPILTIVNSNKANFSPHTYLNKLNMSNCPQLGGNLNVSNSPLLQEIDARGSAITGLLLPTSLRNLEVMRLPNTIQDLTLHDVPLLHTIELDEGNALNSLSLSNCSKLDNCINFDLTKVPTISLDNSFDTEELYMSETTNLTLKNMHSLQRVIFTPNSEYSEFDINNVINGKSYKVTTFNNPKMTDFITTAPHRISYKNGEYGDITPNTAFIANTLDLSDTQFQNVKFLCTTDIYNLKVPTTMKNFYCDSAMDIDTDVIEEASYEVVHNELIEPYTTNYEGEVTRFRYALQTITIDNFENPGMSFPNNTGELIEYKDYNSTGYMLVQGGTEIVGDVGDGELWIAEYDKNLNYIGYLCFNIYYNKETLNNQTRYILISVSKDITSFDITGHFGTLYTPNIIPSSANGSLIFNMYSNNTTQPTSTSPYIWDLTGLKLEDFYTYGMNNWVKPSDNLVRQYSDILPRAGGIRYNTGDNGSTLTCRITMYGAYSLPPIKVKEGDVISHVCKDGYSTRWRYAFTDDNNIIISSNDNYCEDNTTATVPIGATKLWIVITTIHATHNGDYLISEINGVRVIVDKNTQHTTNLSESEILTMAPITLNGNYILADTPTSITMTQRMPGYSVRLVNADITPDEYPTMLYPKLIDTMLPITGKLDYTKYNGSSLAWAYAYTTDDVDINPLGSQQQGNITNDYNKLYSTDFVDIVDVWVYKDTDVSKLSTNEAITKAYIELTSSNYTTRVSEVLTYYPNCTDVYLFEDGSVTSLNDMFNTNNTIYRNQIVNVTFMDGYFDLLTNLKNGFREMKFLKKVNNIPNSVTNMAGCFLSAYELEYVSNLPSNLETADNIFTNCSVMTSFPSFPNNGRIKNLTGAFQSCKALTQAPAIPNSVTNMATTFYECTSLITAPNIPNSVTNMVATFQGCTSLTQAPVIPEGVTNMNNCFTWCTSLIKAPNIPSTCTNIKELCLQCTSMEGDFTFPLDTVTGSHNNCLGGTKISNIIWTGERATDLSLVSINCPNYTQADIQELVPEHLADLASEGKTATLTLGETYGAYLTPDEVFSANAKGWTIVGASSDFTIVNASDDVSGYTTDENVLSCFIELTNANYLTRIDEVLQWYPNCTDLYLFEDGSMTSIGNMFNQNNSTYKNQIINITFIDGYFENVINGYYTFRQLTNLQTVTNLPDNITDLRLAFSVCISLIDVNIPSKLQKMSSCFLNCNSLNKQFDLSNCPLNDLPSAFVNCSSLTYTPILPSNYTGSMQGCFNGCTALTEAPIIPNGVTNMSDCFKNCTSLTTAPVIPQGVTNMQNCFQNCTSLTTAPNIPNSCTNVGVCFNGCTSLKEGAVLHENITTMHQIYADSSVKKIYVPLTNITAYDYMINNLTVNLEDIIWIGERKTDFSIPSLAGNRSIPQQDIQELVPEHLDDLHKDEIKISFSNKKITINNTETTWE